MTDQSSRGTRIPWHAYVLLYRPGKIQDTLHRLVAQGVIQRAPSLWQLELGVIRMWLRVLFRPNSIGTSTTDPVRPGWRAHWLNNRLIRGPFLLLESAIAPWDHTGLGSPSKRLIKHLMAAHHDGHQFAYDLSILKGEPGALEALHGKVNDLLMTDSRRTRWLKDLVVYEGYHESLLAAVSSYLEGDTLLSPSESNNPDVSFEAYIRWCHQQPETPRESWRHWRSGTRKPEGKSVMEDASS